MATKVIQDLIRRWRTRGDLGLRGEGLAARELKRRGYEILERRWRCRIGEIDIVARDGDTVVIVEVKTRTRHDHFSPVDAVDARKQRKLIQLAKAYARSHVPDDVPIRFDIVGITAPPGKPPEIVHLRDAFDASWHRLTF